MNPIILFRINANLCDSHNGGKQGMIGEENVVEINLTSLFVIDKISVSIINSVEQKASEVHSYEVEIHSFYTEYIELFTSLLYS